MRVIPRRIKAQSGAVRAVRLAGAGRSILMLLIAHVAFAAAAAAQVTRVSIPQPVSSPAWTYPGDRPDPTAPPESLFSGDSMEKLQVSAIMIDRLEPSSSSAIVHFANEITSRKLVRAGDRIGRYQIERIESSAVVVRIESLGARRELRVLVGREATDSGEEPT